MGSKRCATWFQLSSLTQVDAGVNGVLQQGILRESVGPGAPADAEQVRMFRRWNIQMRYGYLEGLTTDTGAAGRGRVELVEVDEPV